MSYEQVLAVWAQRYVPAGAKVVSVDLGYSDLYDYTEGTGGAVLNPQIRYVLDGETRHVALDDYDACLTIGGLLSELFAIADKPVAPVYARAVAAESIVERDVRDEDAYGRPELDEDGRDR